MNLNNESKMTIRFIILIISFSLFSKYCGAQTNALSIEAKDIDAKNNFELTMANTASAYSSYYLTHLSNRTHNLNLYLDDNKSSKTKQKKNSKFPAILWGVSAGVLYFGVQKIAFGTTDNACFRGLALSSISGLILGAFVNLSTAK
jgi:hypothetical protein